MGERGGRACSGRGSGVRVRDWVGFGVLYEGRGGEDGGGGGDTEEGAGDVGEYGQELAGRLPGFECSHGNVCVCFSLFMFMVYVLVLMIFVILVWY